MTYMVEVHFQIGGDIHFSNQAKVLEDKFKTTSDAFDFALEVHGKFIDHKKVLACKIYYLCPHCDFICDSGLRSEEHKCIKLEICLECSARSEVDINKEKVGQLCISCGCSNKKFFKNLREYFTTCNFRPNLIQANNRFHRYDDLLKVM
jgi:hypothetical protein